MIEGSSLPRVLRQHWIIFYEFLKVPNLPDRDLGVPYTWRFEGKNAIIILMEGKYFAPYIPNLQTSHSDSQMVRHNNPINRQLLLSFTLSHR